MPLGPLRGRTNFIFEIFGRNRVDFVNFFFTAAGLDTWPVGDTVLLYVCWSFAAVEALLGNHSTQQSPASF